MSKQEAKQWFENRGATVLRVVNHLGTPRVTISWTDYLKVRDLLHTVPVKVALR